MEDIKYKVGDEIVVISVEKCKKKEFTDIEIMKPLVVTVLGFSKINNLDYVMTSKGSFRTDKVIRVNAKQLILPL